MPKDPDPSREPMPSPIYQLRLQGHLDRRWAEWFDSLSITWEDDGETVLSGPVADQAALHGLLTRVRDVGLSIVSVVRVERDPTAAPEPSTAAGRGPPKPEVSD